MVRFTFLLLWGLVPGVAQVLTPNVAPAGPGSEQSIQQATIEAEDGTPFAISPQIIRDAGSSCEIVAVFGSGLVQFRYEYPRVGAGVARASDLRPCVVKIVAAGYRPVWAQLRSGQVIVLKRLGVNEGYTISLQSLNAPAGRGRSMS